MKKYIKMFTSFAVIGTIIFGGIADAQVVPISDNEKQLSDAAIAKKSESLEARYISLEAREGVTIEKKQLPNKVKDFIGKHFSDLNIVQVTQEETLFGFFHKVQLNNEIELNFDEINELVEIESPYVIPPNIIPPVIDDYVAKNYPENKILEWRVNARTQTIILDSDIYLILNHRGEFIQLKES